jgi:hypothetical protein
MSTPEDRPVSPPERRAEPKPRGEVSRLLSDDVMSLGKHCAVWLTGDQDVTADVQNCVMAFQAIEECIRLGQEAHNELVQLRTASPAAHAERPDVIAAALRLAMEATNGWACYAKRKIELDEIGRLHRELKALRAGRSQDLP